MKYIVFIFFLSVFLSCKDNERKLPYYDSADFTPKWEMKNSKTFHAIRKFNLIDQEGENFNEKIWMGKFVWQIFFSPPAQAFVPKWR
ncbi:hypothetical protein ADIARSV_0938 [Arcticibacter svalbardensis MN12-7]|uniref:Uncharacterized protein n=1 Tax=Arcticibacter svalbardensis MN12-7 TaxID=1150600 RepID=R9GVV5_9SPHI|nr:hypothetical protein ADIARSV_0938 [Arcticibacter svalbardensis MN12-7]